MRRVGRPWTGQTSGVRQLPAYACIFWVRAVRQRRWPVRLSRATSHWPAWDSLRTTTESFQTMGELDTPSVDRNGSWL